MSPLDEYDYRVMMDIANALERIATAEERRNKLLEADQAERRRIWQEQMDMERTRLAVLVGDPSMIGGTPAEMRAAMEEAMRWVEQGPPATNLPRPGQSPGEEVP